MRCSGGREEECWVVLGGGGWGRVIQEVFLGEEASKMRAIERMRSQPVKKMPAKEETECSRQRKGGVGRLG